MHWIRYAVTCCHKILTDAAIFALFDDILTLVNGHNAPVKVILCETHEDNWCILCHIRRRVDAALSHQRFPEAPRRLEHVEHTRFLIEHGN
jgi:hypothetical protein